MIVIGGGLAGLSAAIALTEAGFRVGLLEKRPHLGGRATSYWLPDGGQVDNCQHVTMRCCTNLADFYERVGAASKIRFYDRLVFLDRRGRRGVLRASALPAPFHLAPSFAKFPLLRWAEKRCIARAMFHIARSGGQPADAEGVSMLDWLRRHGQTDGAIQRFWRVVLVSALDEELDRTDARYGVQVFWQAFLANRRGFEVGIPAVPLAELYDGCRAAIVARGGEVRLRAHIREIQIVDGRVSAIALADGGVESADFYIAAVPHDVLLELLPESITETTPTFRNLRNLRNSPITGVHFWFDRPVMHDPFLTLLDRTVQWVFNKSRLYEGEGSGPAGAGTSAGQYLQLVISASYDLLPLSRQEIIALCRKELSEALPAARDAQLVQATVIKEAAATFSPAPGCDRWRPGSRTTIGNLFLAGDWTATGWPATMEGAVRSGYRAAEEILAQDGHSRRFLKPDLPVEGIARRWVRA